jgi:foldase protein PrsA
MKKMNGKIACGILASAILAGSFSGCGKLDGTQTVATVDGEKVTLGLANYIVRDQQAQMESYYQMMAQSYGMDMSTMQIWDEKTEDGKTIGESTKDDAMETIHTLYAMKSHADEYDVTISEEEKSKIDEAAKSFMEANSAETLEKLAVSEGDIVTYLELLTYRQKLHDPMVADVDQEVSEKEANQSTVSVVKFSTAGTEKDDEGNTIELTEEEKKAKKEQAQQLLDKLKASENVAEADMDAMAQEIDENLYAYTPSFTTAGSENDTLEQSVINAVANLEDGQLVQEVVEGVDAYYVVRLDKKLDEEATANKKESIISEREQEQYDELVEDWTKDSKLKVEKNVWKKVEVTDSVSFQYKPAEQSEPEEGSEDAGSEEQSSGEETTPEAEPETSEEEPTTEAE